MVTTPQATHSIRDNKRRTMAKQDRTIVSIPGADLPDGKPPIEPSIETKISSGTTSHVPVSNRLNAVQSKLVSDTATTPTSNATDSASVRAVHTSVKAENVLVSVPQASKCNPESMYKKGSQVCTKDKARDSYKGNTEKTETKKKATPISTTSQADKSGTSRGEIGMETRTVTKHLQFVSEHTRPYRKRAAEIVVASKEKVRRLTPKASSFNESTSELPVSGDTAVLQSSTRIVTHPKQENKQVILRSTSEENEEKENAESSVNQRYQSVPPTISQTRRISRSATNQRNPMITRRIWNEQRMTAIPSSRVKSESDPSHRSLPVRNRAIVHSNSRSTPPYDVSMSKAIPQSLPTNTSQTGAPIPTNAMPQRVLRIKANGSPNDLPPKKIDMKDRLPKRSPIQQVLPAICAPPKVTKSSKRPIDLITKHNHEQNQPMPTTSMAGAPTLKTAPSDPNPPVPSSSVSNVSQLTQVNKTSLKSYPTSDALSLVHAEVKKQIPVKSTCAKPLTSAIQRPDSPRESIVRVREVSVNPGPIQKASSITSKDRGQAMTRSHESNVKQESSLAGQPRVTRKLVGKFQKSDRQIVTKPITRASPSMRQSSAACSKRAYPQIMESPIRVSIGESVEAELVKTVSQMNAASTIPLPRESKAMSIAAKDMHGSKRKATKSAPEARVTADRKAHSSKITNIAKEEPIPGHGISRSSRGETERKPTLFLPVDTPKAVCQTRINQDVVNNKLVSADAREHSETPTVFEVKPEPIAEASFLSTRDVGNSQKEIKDISPQNSATPNANRNGSTLSGVASGSSNRSPQDVTKKCVRKKLRGSGDRISNMTGSQQQPQMSSSAQKVSGNPEGRIVVELPYGSTKSIVLTEKDMDRHIPIWNTKMKYKVAGTAAPLGKNIAQYLERKEGEFELYNEQDKFQSVQDRRNTRVTIWHKTEKRKISGTSAPLRKNIQRYLRDHPDCEEYVDQQSKLGAKEKKYANVRVTVWNKKIGRRQGFGQSGPLRKNLKRYLSQHPHLEEYIGQDIGKSPTAAEDEEDKEVGEYSERTRPKQVQTDVERDIKKCCEYPEGEVQDSGASASASASDGIEHDDNEEVVAKMEPQLEDPSQQWDEEKNVLAHDGNPFDTSNCIDMSNIPDLNNFPFLTEDDEAHIFGLEPDLDFHTLGYPRTPGYPRHLVNMSQPHTDVPIVDLGMEIAPQAAALGYIDDSCMDYEVQEHLETILDLEEASNQVSAPVQPIDDHDLFAGLELDGML